MLPPEKTLMSVRGIGPKRYQRIVDVINEAGQTLDVVFQLSSEEIKKRFGIPLSVAQAISAQSTNGLAHATPKKDPLEAKDIRTFSKSDKEFALLEAVLGKAAPETIYAWGNLALLNKPSVGFCGSRNASEKGISIAKDAAKQIAEKNWVVVSGHARGVDSAAHKAALENGGSTIIVVAEGILNFKLRKDLKQIADAKNILIVSEFAPNAGWSVGNAMKRNKTIVALSNAMILVESRLEGGTFDAGKTALRYKRPLFVTLFESNGEQSAGNRHFLERGAIPLRKVATTGQANLSKLIQVLESQEPMSTRADAPKFEQPLLI